MLPQSKGFGNALIALLFCLVSTQTYSRTPPPAGPVLDREGKSYVALGVHYNQFKSIDLTLENLDSDSGTEAVFREFPLTATTYGASLTYGSHITDNFFTELRFGQGLISDKISGGVLEVNIGQWFNWYIGGAIAVTDYANAYAKYGLTFYNAEVTRYEQKRFLPAEVPPLGETISVIPSSTEMEEDLFGGSFSTSWSVGIDFGIFDNTFWSFEYGRLLNDSESGIKVYQLNTLIKYEF